MSEELKIVDAPEETPVKEQPQERDWESEAKAQGWNAEYDGDNKVDAREFVLRKPLFDDLKKLRKKTRDLEAAVMAQQRIHQEQLVKERDRVVKELKAEKKEALQAGDVEKVFDIDERLAEASKPVATPAVTAPREFSEFVDKNPWYETEPHMKRWADSYGIEYKQNHPNATLDEIYRAVTTEVKEAFPHKFENPKRNKPPSVEGGGGTPVANTKEVKVPREHKTIVETMWKQGAWGDVSFKKALESYVKDYTERFGDFD